MGGGVVVGVPPSVAGDVSSAIKSASATYSSSWSHIEPHWDREALMDVAFKGKSVVSSSSSSSSGVQGVGSALRALSCSVASQRQAEEEVKAMEAMPAALHLPSPKAITRYLARDGVGMSPADFLLRSLRQFNDLEEEAQR